MEHEKISKTLVKLFKGMWNVISDVFMYNAKVKLRQRLFIEQFKKQLKFSKLLKNSGCEQESNNSMQSCKMACAD